jgi:ABC-type transporter Mla MlaB component
MALFSKPPAKKPDPAKTDPRARSGGGAGSSTGGGPRPVSAREVAAQAAAGKHKAAARPANEPSGDITVTGASLLDWSSSSTPSAIEVAQANPGLCAVLENAALMYASGQAAQARTVLEQGVAEDEDTKLSPLAWLALFDLLQRAGDRAAFDQLALQYVVQFERSAPAWEESTTARPAASKPTASGYVAVTGKLTVGAGNPFDALKRAIDKRTPHARVDLSQVAGYDDAGARHLAELLATARKQRLDLTLQRPEKLRAALEAAVSKGKAAGEGAWLLSLELMQWQHEQAAFDDRAVEFAIAFELSPPSWEPPEDRSASTSPSAEEQESDSAGQSHALAWSGVLAGSGVKQLAELSDWSISRNLVAVDLSGIERIDFVCAGALLNTINRIENQRKSVQLAGASPIIRALLLLIGISPRHFVRKTPS